jgi:hypothetical protein
MKEQVEMKPGENFHTSAALLIVTAAEKSGLLQEIAQALHYADKTHYDQPPGTVAREFCLGCTLLDAMTAALDEHRGEAVMTLEGFYDKDFVFRDASEDEIAPYLGISSSHSEPRA